MPCFGEPFLHSGLFEEIRHVGVVGEIAYPLCADNVFRPFLRNEPVEFIDVERLAAIIHECAYAVFLSLTLAVMVVMVMAVAHAVVMVAVRMIFLIMLMMPVVVVLMLVMMMLMPVMPVMAVEMAVVVVVVMAVLLFLDVGEGFLNFLNPCGGCHCLLKVEEAGVEKLVEVDVAIVAFQNLGLRLKRAHNFADVAHIFRCHFRDFVEHNYIAKFNLLNHEALDVFFPDVF